MISFFQGLGAKSELLCGLHELWRGFGLWVSWTPTSLSHRCLFIIHMTDMRSYACRLTSNHHHLTDIDQVCLQTNAQCGDAVFGPKFGQPCHPGIKALVFLNLFQSWLESNKVKVHCLLLDISSVSFRRESMSCLRSQLRRGRRWVSSFILT